MATLRIIKHPNIEQKAQIQKREAKPIPIIKPLPKINKPVVNQQKPHKEHEPVKKEKINKIIKDDDTDVVYVSNGETLVNLINKSIIKEKKDTKKEVKKNKCVRCGEIYTILNNSKPDICGKCYNGWMKAFKTMSYEDYLITK
jgi:ribosomal protein S27AE